MTVSPAIRAALEAARDALAAIIADAPARNPTRRTADGLYGLDLPDIIKDARWEAAETARPALEKINAALAEMEAQS